MSDYGASIVLTKKDKTPLTDSEKQQVESIFVRIKAENDFTDALGDDLLFDVCEISNRNDMLQVVFTQYWDDDDEEGSFDFAKENDLEEVEKIAELIQPELGGIFEIIPDFDNW